MNVYGYLLWPDGIRRNEVLLFLNDATPYMVKAGDKLKVLYKKIVPITCISHGLHRTTEQTAFNFQKSINRSQMSNNYLKRRLIVF